MTLTELYRELEHHDWFYCMSDDYSVWARGERESTRLTAEAKKIPGGEKLLADYSAHVFSGPSFGKPKLPKPELPAVCELCATPTTMTGTKRCDRCWELERRIKADQNLARRILASFEVTS